MAMPRMIGNRRAKKREEKKKEQPRKKKETAQETLKQGVARAATGTLKRT